MTHTACARMGFIDAREVPSVYNYSGAALLLVATRNCGSFSRLAVISHTARMRNGGSSEWSMIYDLLSMIIARLLYLKNYLKERMIRKYFLFLFLFFLQIL